NLVYRDFTRVGGTKMPDAKTMGRWGVAVGPVVVKQIHERIVQIARDHRVAQGRRMRVDTTVVETNIHYPTDSSLLGDGVRVLTRTMKKITGIAGAAGTQLRDRSRTKGVKRVCIPNRSTKSPERKREQKKRWFRNGQKWRTGCEGRISVVKRRHGLGRSRYKGDAGIKRWVGLGVIADNLVNISRAMAKQPSR